MSDRRGELILSVEWTVLSVEWNAVELHDG